MSCEYKNSNNNIDKKFSELLVLILGKLNNFSNDDILALLKVFDFIKNIPKNYPLLKNRKNGDLYETHFIEATKIFIKISEYFSLEDIIVVLLHDSIEDVEDFNEKDLEEKFGKPIASSVNILSKKRINKNGIPQEEYEKLKRERDIKYCESLKKCNTRELNAKFADRIHNLRTLYGLDKDFINKVIDETCKYFLPLALERNRKAYDLMFQEIVKLIYHIDSEKIHKILSSDAKRNISLPEIV